MSLEARSERVDVVAAVAAEASAGTEKQSNISSDQIGRMPTSRTPWILARGVPGILSARFDVGGTESAQEHAMTVHGSRDADKRFAIDGLEVNWPGATGGYTSVYYDMGSFSEVTYVTGGHGPEISQGGIYISMITKDGGGQFHGEAAFSGASGHMQSENVSPQLYETLTGQPYSPGAKAGNPIKSMSDLSGNLSGPVVPGKLWFASAFRDWKVNSYVSGLQDPDGERAVDDNHLWSATGKLSWQPNSRLRATAYYNRSQKFRGHRRDGPPLFIDSSASTVQDQPGHIGQLRATFVRSANTVFDFGVGHTNIVFPLRYQPTVQPSTISEEDVVLSTRRGAANADYVNPTYRTVADVGLSKVYREHLVKLGAQVSGSVFKQSFRINGDQAWFFANGVPLFVRLYNSPIGQVTTFHNYAAYISDRWRIGDRLQINYGVRFEQFTSSIPAQYSPGGAWVAGRRIDAVRGMPSFRDAVPRLGVSWRINRAGTQVVRLSLNKYLQNIAADLPLLGHPFQLNSVDVSWTDSNGDKIPQSAELGAIPAFPRADAVFSTRLSRPFSWEASIGYAQHFREWKVDIAYWKRLQRNGIGLFNEAAPTAAYVPTDIVNPLTTKILTVYRLPENLWNARQLLVANSAQLRSGYDGVEFGASWQHRKSIVASGSVTIGRERGAFRGDVAMGVDDLNNPNLNIHRTGSVGLDAPISLKSALSWEFVRGWSASTLAQYFSGYPMRYVIEIPGLSAGVQAVDGQERGKSRLPNVTLIDLRLSRELRIREGRLLTLSLDIFNVPNCSTTTSAVETVGLDGGGNWGRPSAILAPRLLKVGVKFAF
ncbi:MAG: TonB-dependent receptor [Bryobacteraceae bacterium]